MATTQQDVIKKFMKSLDDTKLKGTEALDEAIKACSNFKGIQDAINHMVKDCKNSSSGYYFLRKYCGIDLYNDDTGAITGYDAGGSKVKTAESIVPESGKAKYPSGTSFTKRGLTVIVPEKSTLSEDEQIVVQGLYSWWIEESLKLIEESYGSNYSFANNGKLSNTMYLSFTNEPGRYKAAASSSSLIIINMGYWGEMGLKSDIVNGGRFGYLDRTIAHELTHSIMIKNIYSFYSLPGFIVEGMAELTHGVDDRRPILSLAKNSSKLKSYLNVNLTSWKKEEGDLDYLGGYAAGYMFLRYLAKQGSDVVDNNDYSTINIKTSKFVHIDIPNVFKIQGDEKDNRISNKNSNVTLDAGKGDDSIRFYASSQENIIKYSNGDGNDTIVGYDPSDTIQITSGKYTTIESGEDVKISVGSGSIMLKNANGAKLNIKDTYGDSSTSTPSGEISTKISTTKSTTLTVTNSIRSPVTVDSAINTIDASTRTTAIKITGNSLANTIYGGKGNDTLTGGAGNDVFIYQNGQGDDVITDYAAGKDNIRITSGSISNASLNGSDVVLKVGTGSIKVKNAKNKLITTINSANKTTNLLLGGTGKSTLKGGTAADSIVGNTGADTLTGGKGNDTLTGGAGPDVFIYQSGDGNDVITDYTAQDKISITGGTYTRSTVGNDVKIKIGSGSILLKNAKNTAITINNSRNFIETPWFATDDNFNSAQLDSILKTDFSSNNAGNIINMSNNDFESDLKTPIKLAYNNKK